MLLLASESPRRRELLRKAGIAFGIAVPEGGVEELKEHADPRLLAKINAERKAAAVAERHPGKLVLGADTIVVCGGRIIGKPRDLDDAASILALLSGKVHEVITAVALICKDGNIRDVWCETTRVHFRQLSDDDIAGYLRLVPVLDKAGAYAIQEYGERIVEAVEGDLDNVIGLPVAAVMAHLKTLPAV